MTSTLRIALMGASAIVVFEVIQALICHIHPVSAYLTYGTPLLIFSCVGFFLARTTPGHSVKSSLIPGAFVGLTYASIGYGICVLLSRGKLPTYNDASWPFAWIINMIVACLLAMLGLFVGRLTVRKGQSS